MRRWQWDCKDCASWGIFSSKGKALKEAERHQRKYHNEKRYKLTECQ